MHLTVLASACVAEGVSLKHTDHFCLGHLHASYKLILVMCINLWKVFIKGNKGESHCIIVLPILNDPTHTHAHKHTHAQGVIAYTLAHARTHTHQHLAVQIKCSRSFYCHSSIYTSVRWTEMLLFQSSCII